jgi:hypothetical protein
MDFGVVGSHGFSKQSDFAISLAFIENFLDYHLHRPERVSAGASAVGVHILTYLDNVSDGI